MSILGKIITPGALKIGKEEFVGQLIAYAGLAAAGIAVTKAKEYFFTPIPVEPEVVDAEVVEDTEEPSPEN